MYSFHQSEYRNSSPGSSRYHIIPVPYEATVSYGHGTSKGPGAILEASFQLEKIVEGMEEPGLYGIHTDEAVPCGSSQDPPAVFQRIADRMAIAGGNGAVPLLLGGEHSITNASFIYLQQRYGPQQIGILHFDAHMDLRDSYEGTQWSHASVMRRAVEAGFSLFQVGIRNYCEEEIDARNSFSVHSCDASEIHRLRSQENSLKSIHVPEQFPKLLYITFDLDCFDASLMPATGTPEPGGLFWWDAVELLRTLCKGRTVVGADVVELAPIPNLHHCNYTAAKITYLLMALASPGLSHPSVL